MLETLRNRFATETETRTDGGHSTLGVLTRAENETDESAADGSVTDGSTTTDPAAADSNEESGDDDLDIGLDEIFGTLKNQRRRDVLRYLSAESEQVRLGELAEAIAARECDKDVPQVTSTERKRVYVALYQCHLPKMSDVEAVSYNQPRGTIERGANFDYFDGYLPDEEGTVAATGSRHGWTRSLSGLLTR